MTAKVDEIFLALCGNHTWEDCGGCVKKGKSICQVKRIKLSLLKVLLEELPKEMKSDYTGFEFTKQLAHNECLNEVKQAMERLFTRERE